MNIIYIISFLFHFIINSYEFYVKNFPNIKFMLDEKHLNQDKNIILIISIIYTFLLKFNILNILYLCLLHYKNKIKFY